MYPTDDIYRATHATKQYVGLPHLDNPKESGFILMKYIAYRHQSISPKLVVQYWQSRILLLGQPRLMCKINIATNMAIKLTI